MFEHFFQNINELACIASLEGTIIRVNKEYVQKVGNLELPFRIQEIIHRDDRGVWNFNWQKLVVNEVISIQLKSRLKVKCGEYSYVQWNLSKYEKLIFITGRVISFDIINSSAKYFLQDQNNKGIIWINHAGDVEYVNDRLINMLGYDYNELKKFKIYDLDLNKSALAFSFYWDQCIKSKKLKNTYCTVFKCKNKHDVTVEIVFKILDGTNLIMYVEDVTDKKRKETRIALVNAFIDNTSDAVLLGNMQGGFDFVNKRAYELYGYSKEEFEHITIFDIDKEFSMEKYDLHNPLFVHEKQNQSIVFEANHTKKNGESFPVEINTVFIRLEPNVFVLNFIRDISDRKNREAELNRRKKILSNAHRIAKMGIWELDLINNVLDWNTELFEITEVDPLRFNPSMELFECFIHPADYAMYKQHFYDSITLKKCEDLELRILLDDGREKFIIITGEIVLDKEDTPVRMYGIVQDITEQKKQQQQLIEAKERAEQSDNLKSAFLANVSHEIRTPMNAIIGFSSFLKDPENSFEEINQFADIIINSGEHLLELIDDIVDISKIDAGQVDIIKQNVNVSGLLNDIYCFYKSFLKTKNKCHLDLILDNPAENVFAYTDEMRLRKILFNLVGNAIKFTDKGFVKIGFEKHGTHVKFSIQDTGIGISLKNQEVIFQRFQQGIPTTEKIYGGTGLGLAIAKACVGLLGGEISFTSEVEVGTTFYFSIQG